MRRLLPLALALALLAPAASAHAAANRPIVAVIDSGVDVRHPAFAGELWSNPRERRNGRDDDGNGLVDDLHGWDFAGGDASVADGLGHGTAVAGVVAEQGGRSVRIMALRAGGAEGPNDRAIVRSIAYALRHGARVLNLSFGADFGSAWMEKAFRGWRERVLVVAGAGNDGQDVDAKRVWPCASSSPNVLCVAAATPTGLPAEWTNFGRRTVDLAAPGTDIRAPRPGGGSHLVSGTSFAAPFVSAAAARLWAQRPRASAHDIRGALLGAVRVLPEWSARVASGGVLDGAPVPPVAVDAGTAGSFGGF